MGKSKRHRHRKKVKEEQVSSSSSGESDSDTSGEAMCPNPKRRKYGRPSIIPDDAYLDVGNDDLYPARETRFKDWDAHVLVNLEVQRDLGLSKLDKERWDKALQEMISLRSIYNERRRTGKEDIGVPRTSSEKSVQTLNEVEDVGTQSEAIETEPVNGGCDGSIPTKVEIKSDKEDFNVRVPCQTTVFLDDVDDEDNDMDCANQSQVVNSEVCSTSTPTPSSRDSKSSESSTSGNGKGQGHIKSNTPASKSSCSPSNKSKSGSSLAPLTRLQKRISPKSSTDRDGPGHVKSKIPAMEEPTLNDLNRDDETASTSRNCSLPLENASSDGGHMLPNLPTCYRNRRLRVLKGRNCQSEEEFFNTVGMSSTSKAIAICGSTGMGITTLLAQMGRKITSAFPGRKLFYLQMKNVIDAVTEELGKKGMPMTELVWSALRHLTREKDLGKVTVNPKGTRTELFFDGFYDIQKENEKLVCNILKCISDSFNSTGIRMWIATVPYDFKKLERVLQNAESYSLEPLDYASQVELIASYLELHISEGKPKLFNFVEKCLKDLSSSSNCHLELGNPLQCLLIGAACLKEKLPDYKTCLSTPKNILDINDNNENLLLDAALKSSFHTLELILGLNKFNINSKDKNGDTPLLLSACAKGNVDCLPKLKLLVEKGADLDNLNKCNDNLLLYAARYGSLETLEYILNMKKFDIECVDIYGNTPLFLSADGIDIGNVNCLPKLKLLIKHKANLNHVRKGKLNLLLYAAQFASAEVLEYILSLNKFDVNCKDEDGDSPVLLSVFQYEGIDCRKKLEMLRAHGGNLHHVNKIGINLLHYTAQYGSLDVLKYVISLNKFGINSRDKYGETAMYYAKIQDNEEGVKNVDMNAKIKFLTGKGCKA